MQSGLGESFHCLLLITALKYFHTALTPLLEKIRRSIYSEWLISWLQYCSEGLLPGVCAGAEAMGSPADLVIPLSMVNISHVTAALLVNSLFLCFRHC